MKNTFYDNSNSEYHLILPLILMATTLNKHNDNAWCDDEYKFALNPGFYQTYLKTPPGLQENKFNFGMGHVDLLGTTTGTIGLSNSGSGCTGGCGGGNGQSNSPTFSWGAFDPSVGSLHPK